MRKPDRIVRQPNALLTFTGEQDIDFFVAALNGAAELGRDNGGGSRDLSIRAEGGDIVLGYKKELDT